MSKLFYRKADGPDLQYARRRKAAAKLALGWTIITGMGLGFLYLIALGSGAPFLGVLGIAAGIVAFSLTFTYGIMLVSGDG